MSTFHIVYCGLCFSYAVDPPKYGSQEMEEGRKCERELKVYLNRSEGISGD